MIKINNDMNIIGVIQARMGSKRLPGKSLKTMNGKPMLQHIINNVISASLVSKFVVATSELNIDDNIYNLCLDLKIDCFRGSESDVLSRFVGISKIYNADLLVRLTGDNPFVENKLIDFMINKFFKMYSSYDYVHNVENSGFPYGLYVEIFTKNALNRAQDSKDIHDKEHVTRYFKRHAENFKIGLVKTNKKFKYSHLTVDNEEEFIKAENLMRKLNLDKKQFSYKDLY